MLKLALKDETLRFKHSLFIQLLSDYLDETEALADFEKYIIKGQLIDFTDELPKGLSLVNQEGIPVFRIQAADKSELTAVLKR